jgi:glycosyltransferase involved in cell wall biosynthesis
MSKHFITFGTGEKKYYDAVNRLTTQAESLQVFDSIRGYSEEDLQNDEVFWNQHSTFVQENSRGYGYCLWKSYLIKKKMADLKDGDILLYLDCGCELDIRKKQQVLSFFDFVKQDKIIGTKTQIEKVWNKMDLILKLDMFDPRYLESPQHQAGAILFLVCSETRNLVNMWYGLGSEYHNIDDTPSIQLNMDCFREHRHDQSVFSLLTKKYNLYSNHSLFNCLNYNRNISGVSKLSTVEYENTEIIYSKKFCENAEIIYSIVIPVYNQENIIVENIQSIMDNTIGSFEIIIILDFCFDGTEKNVLNFLQTYTNSNSDFIAIRVFKNRFKPLFETKCDNIGFKNSVGKYCLEIQSDMKMTEYGYNKHLTKPFDLHDNVIAVSGRCAHNLYSSEGVGKLGMDIEKNINELQICKNKFYVYETCNRGPLLLDRKKIKELNYLDEMNYFLDDSDHDLMARAFLEKGYICGYVPIDFYAPLYLGSTRNNKTYNYCKEYLINKTEKEALKQRKTNGLQKYRNVWIDKQPMVYDI